MLESRRRPRCQLLDGRCLIGTHGRTAHGSCGVRFWPVSPALFLDPHFFQTPRDQSRRQHTRCLRRLHRRGSDPLPGGFHSPVLCDGVRARCRAKISSED